MRRTSASSHCETQRPGVCTEIERPSSPPLPRMMTYGRKLCNTSLRLKDVCPGTHETRSDRAEPIADANSSHPKFRTLRLPGLLMVQDPDPQFDGPGSRAQCVLENTVSVCSGAMIASPARPACVTPNSARGCQFGRPLHQ
jgi:hypothetical protein